MDKLYNMGCLYQQKKIGKPGKVERKIRKNLFGKIEKNPKKYTQMDRRNPGKKVVILMMMHNAMVFTYYITLFLVCIMHVVSIISNNHIVMAC